MNKVWIVISVLLLGLLIFICVDCCAGRTRYFESSIINRHYVPARTEVSTYIDGDGNASVSTTYYPEEFHLICQDLQGTTTFDVSTSRKEYYTKTNDQQVLIRTREGKWTKSNYIPCIED